MYGHPVQFLTRNKDDETVKFNLTAVEEMLDKVGGRPLAVVSVNGDERTGKSTLLNLLLHYMKSDQGDLPASPVPPNLPGFEWKAGLQPTTFGMAFWSEPFFIRDADNREIAVLFLDTQGTDHLSQQSSVDRANQEAMFCLSMWLSSVFICNVQGRYIADSFQLPRFFTDLITIFCHEEFVIEPPLFQNLLILFRDWHLFKDYPYGVHKGVAPRSPQDSAILCEPRGKGVIEKLMEIIGGDDGSSAKCKRNTVCKLFSEISAFLLPFPGSEIASNYDGIFGIHEESPFLEQVWDLGEVLFKSPYAQPKLCYGKEITGTDLKALMARWDQLFRLYNGAPHVRAIGGAVVDHHLENISKRIQAEYDATMTEVAKKGLDEKDFYAAHAQCRGDCLDSFKDATKKFSKFPDKLRNAVYDLSYYLDRQFIVHGRKNHSQQVEHQLRQKVAFLTDKLTEARRLQESQSQEIRANKTTIRQLEEDKEVLEKANQLQISMIDKYQFQLSSFGIQTSSYNDDGDLNQRVIDQNEDPKSCGEEESD